MLRAGLLLAKRAGLLLAALRAGLLLVKSGALYSASPLCCRVFSRSYSLLPCARCTGYVFRTIRLLASTGASVG